LAHVHYRKFATVQCVVSPPKTVCISTLPCKNLIILLLMFFTFTNTINILPLQKISSLHPIHVNTVLNADSSRTFLACVLMIDSVMPSGPVLRMECTKLPSTATTK